MGFAGRVAELPQTAQMAGSGPCCGSGLGERSASCLDTPEVMPPSSPGPGQAQITKGQDLLRLVICVLRGRENVCTCVSGDLSSAGSFPRWPAVAVAGSEKHSWVTGAQLLEPSLL